LRRTGLSRYYCTNQPLPPQSTGRLDEGEEEESEVTREARAGREGGKNEVEETRGWETAEEKVEAAGEMEREGEKRRGDAPRVSKASHEIRV